MKPSDIFNIFRKPVTTTGFSPVYLASKRAWNERYSLHEQNAVRWRWIAIFCIGVAAVAVIGLVYDDSLSKFVPYIVERDHLGDEVAIGVPDQLRPCDPRTIQTEVNEWIFDVRHVSSDGQDENRDQWKAYHHVEKGSPAEGELTDWFRKNDPLERAKTELVMTTTISTLPRQAGNYEHWEARWREDTRTRSGDPIGSVVKEASITTTCLHPRTETEFKNNASGVFVRSFDWKN